MPIFYNTNSPTPTTSNSINNVSIDIRDFLLNQNISSTYPSISTAVNGSPRVGEPVLNTESNHLNFYPHQQLDLNTQGLDILGSVLNGQGVGIGAGGTVVPNFDVRSSIIGRVLGASGLLNDTRIGTIGAQQLALALANNAAFNVEQDLLGALNVQDNVLALVKGAPLPGFRPSYQITIPSGGLARAADFTGKVLGFTIPRSYLNPGGSIFQDENENNENIARANSMILNTGKGQVLALLANAEANLTVNSTKKGNSMYSPFRSGYAPGYKNNKGVLQITNNNLYAYTDKEGKFINILSTTDSIIPDMNFMREGKVSASGFKSPEDLSNVYKSTSNHINNVGFSWASTTDGTVNSSSDLMSDINVSNFSNELNGGDKKSLLVKTQKLFNSKGMQSIVSVKGDMGKVSTQTQTTNGGGFSKGNAVMKRSSFTADGYYDFSKKTADETYCRSWTTFDRYDRINKLVRSGTDSIEDGGEEYNGIYGRNKVPYRDTRGGSHGSILDKYGFPKIVPYTTDKETDIKQYMFSIENLAWADVPELLPPSEVGPGDLVNGKKGRIMWFPPYDINFSESNAVSWESTNFIGRGEPIYTYNNTERTGNLSFKIVVDHPSYANSFRGKDGPDDHYVNSFWAGCIPPEFKDKLTVTETSWSEVLTHTIPAKTTIEKEPAPDVNLVVYFPNDNVTLPTKYENGLSGASITDRIDYSQNPNGNTYGIGNYAGKYTKGIHLKTGWNDNTNYGLNGHSWYSTPIEFNDNVYWGWQDKDALFIELEKYLKEKCPNCVCEVKGFASQQGTAASNKLLVDDRADAIIAVLNKNLFQFLPENERKNRFIKKTGTVPDNPACKPKDEAAIDKLPCKKDRRAEVTFKFDNNLVAEKFKKPDIIVEDGTRKFNKKITDRLYNEMLYFDQLTDIDPLVFDSFRMKIKYFHPAFHSTTPEGLNSRLNFLLQCTRQGPTTESQNANNLAFGRPPVCILRIGDFYNTKIVMDSVNIDYEPLVWDLNPEGIGVQPMIANVTISFKFLGGSSLMGPINKLQNALSFNYFANTQVYDARADYIAKGKVSFALENTDGTKVDPNAKDTLPGYQLMDGVKNYKSNIKEEITSTDFPFTPDVDQLKTQENDLSGIQEVQIPFTNTADTKLTTFSYIDIKEGFNTGEYIFYVAMNCSGFYTRQGSTYDWKIDYAGDDFKSFVNKGIKVRLLKGNNIVREEVIPFDTPELKKASLFMTGGIKLGDASHSFDYSLTLTPGNDYVLECWYNGNKVCSQNVEVRSQSPYFSYYNATQ